MKILRTLDEVHAWRAEVEAAGRRVAFVPTMGYLHDGHLSLIREGRRRNPDGPVLLSIFVNPTQFAAGEDLDVYPRDEAGDLAKAESAGADVAFCPLDPAVMYGEGAPVWVQVEGLESELCGRSRPTHFRGVCTVVSKLLNLVRPHWSIFGQKDYQQLAIIRRMHAELFLPGEIVGMPIVREADGLAMSSRNAYLSAEERGKALALSAFLDTVEARFSAGEREVAALLEGATDALSVGEIDYVELVDAATLRPLEASAQVDAAAVLALAVRFEGARLIDNRHFSP